VDGDCKSLPDECFDMWTGAVQSAPATFTITSDAQETGSLTVQADLHIVGPGTFPGNSKTPIVDMVIKAFDKSEGSCARGYGVSWHFYPDIYTNCTEVGQDYTDASGEAVITLPAGDYIVIGEYTENSPDFLYPGVSASDFMPDSGMRKYLQVIQNSKNEKIPGKYRRETGSELLIIEPEYVLWDETEELYPFIFETIGDWEVTTSVEPPEGFVADHDELTADIDNTLEAVQFTVTDVGSKWVSTKVKFKVKHNGQTKDIDTKVGIKLSKKKAKKLKLSIYGEEDPNDQGEDDQGENEQ
jgi:hypothetical protein